MTTLYQVEQLRNQIQQYRTQVSAFVQEATKSSAALADELKLSIAKDNGKPALPPTSEEQKQRLEQREKLFLEDARKLRQQLEREMSRETELRASVDQLRGVESQLPEKVVGRRQAVQSLQEELSSQKNALTDKENSKKAILSELGSGMSFYKERLGLEFQRLGANRLRFTFTMIDSEQEDRAFYFSVYITKDDKYQVEECSPTLSTTCLTPLLEQLNATNNFAQFVRAMRKQFKDSVAK